MQHPSGEVYGGGYPNAVFRYDPTLPWTLTNANAAPTLPSDANRPNPYFIKLTTPLTHYRHCMDYDGHGVVWIGGMTYRNQSGTSTFDIGTVIWYDPSDGSTSSGSMFPSWATSPGVKFGNLCAANNRSQICVSDNAGNIWIVDAATKAVDPNPIVHGIGGRTYMIEVQPDVVLGIVISGTTYKVVRFKPSTKEILTLQDLGVSGIPFGWSDGEANRKNYKLELGPDGYVWMFVGASLYRINPTTCAFTKVLDASFANLKFAPNNVDLLLYFDGTTNFKYIPGILQAVSP
jgi:hypothetical protein